MKRAFVGLAAALFCACGSGGSNSNNTPCTVTWSGAVSGSASCDGAASDELLALAGTGAASLNWLVVGEDANFDVSYSFQVPNPPSANNYSGIATTTQFCVVSLTPKSAGAILNATSLPNASTGPSGRGSCDINFTSKVDTSSNLTVRYTVHGTANAMVQAVNNAGVTAQVTVTF